MSAGHGTSSTAAASGASGAPGLPPRSLKKKPTAPGAPSGVGIASGRAPAPQPVPPPPPQSPHDEDDTDDDDDTDAKHKGGSRGGLDVGSGSRRPPFLNKLSNILMCPDNHAYINWTDDGRSIVVKQLTKFSEIVLPKYFKHSRFSSFLRQLNMYNFYTSNQRGQWREFTNPMFTRDDLDSSAQIKRKAPPPNQQTVSKKPRTVKHGVSLPAGSTAASTTAAHGAHKSSSSHHHAPTSVGSGGSAATTHASTHASHGSAHASAHGTGHGNSHAASHSSSYHASHGPINPVPPVSAPAAPSSAHASSALSGVHSSALTTAPASTTALLAVTNTTSQSVALPSTLASTPGLGTPGNLSTLMTAPLTGLLTPIFSPTFGSTGITTAAATSTAPAPVSVAQAPLPLPAGNRIATPLFSLTIPTPIGLLPTPLTPLARAVVSRPSKVPASPEDILELPSADVYQQLLSRQEMLENKVRVAEDQIKSLLSQFQHIKTMLDTHFGPQEGTPGGIMPIPVTRGFSLPTPLLAAVPVPAGNTTPIPTTLDSLGFRPERRGSVSRASPPRSRPRDPSRRADHRAPRVKQEPGRTRTGSHVGNGGDAASTSSATESDEEEEEPQPGAAAVPPAAHAHGHAHSTSLSSVHDATSAAGAVEVAGTTEADVAPEHISDEEQEETDDNDDDDMAPDVDDTPEDGEEDEDEDDEDDDGEDEDEDDDDADQSATQRPRAADGMEDLDYWLCSPAYLPS